METKKAAPKIEGKLAPKSFADILKRLEGNRGAAYLLISDGLAEKCLYFSVGAIRLSSMGKRRGVRLDDSLAAHPRVEPSMVERARDRQAQTGEPFEEVLAAMFELNEVVRECSTAIVRDEFQDILFWEGAYYEFVETNPPPKIFDPRLEAVKLSFGVAKLIKETSDSIPRAQKLLARVAGGKARISRGPAWAQGAPADADEPVCRAIALGIGEKGAAFDDVLLHARREGVEPHRFADAFEKMLDGKTIESGKKGGALSKEEEADVARRDVGEIENALDLMINEMVARQRLAQGYLAMGDQNRAVYNLKRVGDELLQRNRADEAIDAYRQVVKITPHDFGVREKIAFLFERLKKIPEAVAEGLDLAKLYKQFGLFNRAKNIFRRVISLEPQNVDHRKQLIELLVKTKENQEAVAEYENLAQLFAQRQDDGNVVAAYQRILALDPAHAAARARTQAIVRRRPGFWVPYVAVAAGFAILVAVVALVASEYRSVTAYKQARRVAFERVDQRPVPDYDGARRAIEDFLRLFGSGRMAERAMALKQQIAGLEEERRIRQAREEYGEAIQLVTGGRPDRARDKFTKVAVDGRGTEWEKKARDQIREIDKLAEEADHLLTRVRRHEAEGNLREAWERARELTRRFVWSDAAQRLAVKLQVTSMPPGAAVTVGGGQVRGRTPCTVQNAAAQPFEVELARDGFKTARRKVDLREDSPFPLHFDLQKATRWDPPVKLRGPIEAPPLVEDGGIFVAARDQRVYSLDLDGRLRWERTLGLLSDAVGSPVRAGSRIVVGDRTGTVTALEGQTGAVAWRARTQGAAAPVPGAPEGVVVVADAAGFVAGLDAASGRERWRVAIPGGLAAAPVAGDGDGVIAVASGDAVLHLIDAATGAERAKLSTVARATAPPAISGMGFIVATEGEIVRLIARDGSRVWEARAPGPVDAAPLATGATVYVAAGNALVALDAADGKERWARRDYAAGIRATPAFRANRLYVPAGDGAVHSLTAETGLPRWSFKTQGEVVAQPVCVSAPAPGGGAPETTVFVASTDFGLYAIRD